MERILMLVLLRFIITLTNIPQVELQAIGTDCNGKRFICVDRDRFQVCADVPGNRTETTDDVMHACAPDTLCNDDGMVECDSTAPFDEMVSVSEDLSETEDTSTTVKNAEDFETSDLDRSSTTSATSTTKIFTMPTLASNDVLQEDTEKNPTNESSSTDTTMVMTEIASTDLFAPSIVAPESTVSSFVPLVTELRLDITAATEVDPSATSDQSQNEDFQTADESSTNPPSVSNVAYEATSSISDVMTSLEPQANTTLSSTLSTTPEFSTTEQPPAATTASQSTTTEKRFFCELPGSYPHESNCHKYYVCVKRPYGFIRFELSCYFGMAFDPISHQCVFNQRACHPTKDTFVCPSDGKYPDPSSVDRYYWCMENGTDYLMYQMSCPYGQRFNGDSEQCQDWSGPDVVITSGGMDAVVVDESGDSSSESDDSDDSNE